jgi:hypothetical protein
MCCTTAVPPSTPVVFTEAEYRAGVVSRELMEIAGSLEQAASKLVDRLDRLELQDLPRLNTEEAEKEFWKEVDWRRSGA